ncbi:MAG TPA: hypothetical protein VFG11_04340 [Acidobacteriota bacterium]|nr:hypothetical protein [Acidobacteriota bacterium]
MMSSYKLGLKPWILLRVASVITFLYFVGHTMGMPWTPVRGPNEVPLLKLMKADHFYVMGLSRSYQDFYFGFGVAISGFLLLQAVLLWQLGTRAKVDPAGVRSMVTTFTISFLANAIVVGKYFFALPLILAIAIAACLGFALIMTRPQVSDFASPVQLNDVVQVQSTRS